MPTAFPSLWTTPSPRPINCRPFRVGRGHRHPLHHQVHGRPRRRAGRLPSWTAASSTGRPTPDKFPGLCTPDDSYHGVTYTERFGLGGAFITKCTAQLMRDFGCIQSPQSAFLLNLGLESLHVRMDRHCENAQAVAEFLQEHEKVAWVNYRRPARATNTTQLAQKYMPNGTCGVVSFGVKGGREAAETFMKHLKLAAIETHVADAQHLLPAPRQHHPPPDDRRGAGRRRGRRRPRPSELRAGKRPGSYRGHRRRHWRTCNQEESVMPIQIPNDLPAAGILQQENIFVMRKTRAATQHIRPLRNRAVESHAQRKSSRRPS